MNFKHDEWDSSVFKMAARATSLQTTPSDSCSASSIEITTTSAKGRFAAPTFSPDEFCLKHAWKRWGKPRDSVREQGMREWVAANGVSFPM
jgi:hypothetical protein